MVNLMPGMQDFLELKDFLQSLPNDLTHRKILLEEKIPEDILLVFNRD